MTANNLKITEYIDNVIEQPDPPRNLRNVLPANYTTLNYFFEKLENPRWLEPLRSKGYFRDPPSIDPQKSEHVRWSLLWPQTAYLRRVVSCGDHDLQSKVLQIFLDVGKTNNHIVHYQFADIALLMEIDLAARWASHEVKWLINGNQIDILLEDSLSKLVVMLAEQGEAQVALELAAELLAVSPDPEAEKKRNPSDETEEVIYASFEPQIRCEKYYYKDLLSKTVPVLASSVSWETMKLLCELLYKAFEYSSRDPEESKLHDLSYVSRPAIEDHEQNNDYYFQNDIISHLRDVAVTICQGNPERIAEVVTVLEGFEWDIFKRISLYLLQVIESVPVELIERRLLDEEYLDSTSMHHEYYHLLKKRFELLQQKQQRQLFRLIGDAVKEKQRLEETDQPFSKEQKQAYLEHWQFRKLNAIESHIPADLQDNYRILKERFQESERPPDFISWTSGGWVGSVSPIDIDEMAQMSTERLISYFKEWESTEGIRQPTPDGLGSVFSTIVSKDPARFAHEVDSFMDDDLDPTYVRNWIVGFRRVTDDGKPIPFV